MHDSRIVDAPQNQLKCYSSVVDCIACRRFDTASSLVIEQTALEMRAVSKACERAI